MATIVEYNSGKNPLNAYPERIVSPFQPDSCCADHMMQVGKVEEERGFLYYYRRCRVCGFTIRYFLPVLPPEQPLRIRSQGRLLPRVGEVA